MRIKRVEIIGFKSFCDRAVVQIDQSITAVVGPNGCGKSNIVDAIRWCMGEQSAKHLRGKAMEDVIFAGSESRGPAPMAEVSLTFDDVGFSHETLELALESDEAAAERALEEIAEDAPAAAAAEEEEAEGAGSAADLAAAPGEAQAEVAELLADRPPALDFARYTEVTITRRLYRDGTSQYFINKTHCRLRDITDFFLGTGVGTKAYSIIEQGRIGQIVSARPVDRRAIIEEAAGITKFKSKKKAAERKLDQTRQNLLRVSDIASELDKRMGSLRRQAQKAERYRTYKTELRDIELCKASHRFLELRAEDLLVSGRLGEARTDLDDARATLAARDAQVVAERAELALEERRLAGLQEALYEVDNRVRLAESKVDFQRREAGELDERVTRADAEIAELAARLAEATAQLAAQEEELAALAERVAEEDGEVAGRETMVSEARQMLANAQGRLDEARALLAAARTDVAKCEGQRESLGRRREEAQRRLARVREDSRGTYQRSREVEREHKRVGQTLGRLRQTRLDLGVQADGFETRRDRLADEVARAEAEVETLRTELHRRRSRRQSLLEIQERYEGFARGTRAVMQKAPELGRIRGLVADVVRAPEALEIAVEAALGDRLGGVLVEDHQVGLAAVGYLKQSGAGRSAFVPLTAAEAAAAEAAPAPPPAADTVPAALDAGWSGGWSPVAPGEPGAPAAPGGGIEFEDRSQLMAAAAAAPEVRGEGVLGPMSELVELAEGYQRLGQALLGDYVVVDNLERAIALHREGVRQPLVTLDGDIVDVAGVLAGGSREAQGAGVLGQKREIRELEEIVGALEHDLAEATARLVTGKTELTQVHKAIEGLRGQAHEGDLAIMGHEKDAARTRHELERTRERLGQLGAEQRELEERLRAVEADEAELSARHADAEGRIDRFEREQLALIEGVTGGRERVDELAAALTEARVRAAQLGEKRASAQAAALRLGNVERELAGRIERLRAQIAEGRQRAEQLRADSAELEAELAGLRERRADTGAELEAGRQAYEARLAELTAVELAVRELRSRADRLGQEVAQLEVRHGAIASSRQLLLDTIWDRYQVEVGTVIFDFHLRPPTGEAEEERLTELRALIERMGTDINLTAIEEYAEVSQRFEFLSTQKNDLERAVDQLQRAIDKINKTSRRLFKETFHAVNTRFKEVFPRLFRGGQAHLSLAGASDGGEVDLLECGIEIMAQPPGKKNTTVDQLSGGEKALTAVALIFSIFLIKPSPFCILDEVDAPLDEANVDRYNEIVREMTDRSQFIVITHNKRTMESADNLYGVTMQEPGVSKLVSVNLSRIAAGERAAS
jgi:chromosome segregation protein